MFTLVNGMFNYDVNMLEINSFFRYICIDDWIWAWTGG